jgi:hypothetical protein
VLTAEDDAAWRSWRRSRKLAQQRERRSRERRIDYYPGTEAAAVIDEAARESGLDYSRTIDAIILAWAAEAPE